MVNEKYEILKLLIENQDEIYSIRKLSQIRNINYKSAYNAIKQLEKEEIINCEKIGNTTSCKFNKRFNQSVFIVEFLRRKEFLKNKNFKVIYNDLKKIESLFIVLIFGSQVKGTHTKNSDINILIIADDAREIESKLSLIPLRLHIITISIKELMSMAKSKEFTVVSEAIKNNIILIGIEDYYRLLEKTEN